MRIEDVSPTDDSFTPTFDRASQSVAGKGLCIAVSRDGRRAYLGGHSGVWRSDDGGDTWSHPEWRPARPGGPTAAGALPPTNVYSLVIDAADNEVVFAGTGRDGRVHSAAGIYRSSDGARTWTLVHRFTRTSGTATTVGLAGCVVAVPDDHRTLYAAGELAIAWTTDGGATWTERVPDPAKAALHVVAGPARPGGRRVYAAGDGGLSFSLDGGMSWQRDPVGLVLGAVTDGAGASCQALAIDPQHDDVVYLVRGDLTLWRGEYPGAPSTAPGRWTQLPAPPPVVQTDSGGTFVVPYVTPEGNWLLYVSDRRSVHVIGRLPTASSEWSRVEDNHCHADPHGLALTPDFRPWAIDDVPASTGRALLVNDGGVNVSTDGMRTWTNARGLSTLNVVNVAVNSAPGKPTAITFGTGDNEGFSTSDGAAWRTQNYFGGDNDCSFSDPRQPQRMVLFAPRSVAANGVGGEIYLFASADDNPPSTAVGSSTPQRIPAPPAVTDMNGRTTRGWNAVSYYFTYGYRPLVLTPAGQKPRPDGDLVTIRFLGVVGVDPAIVLRTTALSQITSEGDWVTTATAEGAGVKAFQVGPPLPDPLISTVQASGGHDAPTLYAGNAAPTVTNRVGTMGLWKLAPGGAAWQQVVPGRAVPGGPPAPTIARRFFVDPYRPANVYVLGSDHVHRSDDGGASWKVDASLERMLTEDGAFPFAVGDTGNPAESILRDMQFDPGRPGFRLAAGIAGVFMTRDGRAWEPLLRSTAVAMQPTSITYDPVPCERAVYVGTSNRGLLRLTPLPPDWEFPRGSLQAATGRITLLRVHDVGTGYGPPEDFIDAEIIVTLDTQPEKAFGLQLRDDADGPVAEGMLDVLRDCFNHDRPARIEFLRSGCRNGEIVRVIAQT